VKGGGRIFLILEEFGVVLSKCHMDVDMGQQIDPENRIFGSLLITGFHFDQLRLVGWKLS
jgi:hypothetical protein